MRKDMAKVVTEAPRYGHQWPSRKWGRTLTRNEIPVDNDELLDYDSGPLRTGRWSRQYGDEKKRFSDVLGPLRGYLRKQVGRPWDKVWSELSANLDKRSVSGSHIFDHIKQEVQQECWLAVDGKVYYRRRYSPEPTEVTGLYVHPFTHLLCYKQEVSWRRKFKGPDPLKLKKFGVTQDTVDRREGRYVIQDEWTVWERTDHGWFIHTYREKDPKTIVKVERVGDRYKWQLDFAKRWHHGAHRIAELERLYADDTPVITYLGPGHKERVSKRQAGKKDIRRAGKLLSSGATGQSDNG